MHSSSVSKYHTTWSIMITSQSSLCKVCHEAPINYRLYNHAGMRQNIWWGIIFVKVQSLLYSSYTTNDLWISSSIMTAWLYISVQKIGLPNSLCLGSVYISHDQVVNKMRNGTEWNGMEKVNKTRNGTAELAHSMPTHQWPTELRPHKLFVYGEGLLTHLAGTDGKQTTPYQRIY